MDRILLKMIAFQPYSSMALIRRVYRLSHRVHTRKRLELSLLQADIQCQLDTPKHITYDIPAHSQPGRLIA